MKLIQIILLLIIYSFTCSSENKTSQENEVEGKRSLKEEITYDTTLKTIHILVALCDNKYQGIVPVPAGIGNGQNCNSNLYWGCGYGIRSYFKKSKEWKWVKTIAIDSIKMERVVFKHVSKNYYLIADAYNGKYIKTCTEDFLKSCSGSLKDTIQINNKVLGINGHAKMLSYIGHDGFMDFELDDTFTNADGRKRDCIILACISKSYFSPYLKLTKSNPLLWTTGLMCPEAYTVHDAITGYINNENAEAIRTRAAMAYSKYHPSCSVNCAKRLLVTGF
jgi:hypothetical protein